MALTRTEINELLDRFELAPSRALGQNFLCDPQMISKIVRLAGVKKGDKVLEIGPGLGSLTLGLCEAGANVTAIEIDKYIIPALEHVLDEAGQRDAVELINSDVLKLDWPATLGEGSWNVVANLPYNISTPLILDLLASQPQLASWLVMVQREAGERLAASPGSKIYGIPSVLASYWGTCSVVSKVPAELFLPKPRVESVLVKIDRHNELPSAQRFKKLAALVKAGFGQRRKMLRRSLAAHLTAEQIQTAVAPTARAEELSLTQWLALVDVAETVTEITEEKETL